VRKNFRPALASCFSQALLLALTCVCVTGCFKRKAAHEPSSAVRTIIGETNAVITPLSSAVGRITSVNQQVMIAVVSFPVGQVPSAGGRYSVFRAGQKVGELKLSEETADTLRVADITSGSAQIGDEVRMP
jgi:hypothetical protein